MTYFTFGKSTPILSADEAMATRVYPSFSNDVVKVFFQTLWGLRVVYPNQTALLFRRVTFHIKP